MEARDEKKPLLHPYLPPTPSRQVVDSHSRRKLKEGDWLVWFGGNYFFDWSTNGRMETNRSQCAGDAGLGRARCFSISTVHRALTRIYPISGVGEGYWFEKRWQSPCLWNERVRNLLSFLMKITVSCLLLDSIRFNANHGYCDWLDPSSFWSFPIFWSLSIQKYKILFICNFTSQLSVFY